MSAQRKVSQTYLHTGTAKIITRKKYEDIQSEHNDVILSGIIQRIIPDHTRLLKMIVGVLTTCHTQYT